MQWRSIPILAAAVIYLFGQGGDSAEAREVRRIDATHNLTQADWWRGDRARYAVSRRFTEQDGNRSGLIGHLLAGENTFVSAAFHNTALLNSASYETVAQRHEYYDLIGFLLEHGQTIPEPLRGIRFFHAAAEVTSILQLGAVGVLDTWRQSNPAPGLADRCAGIGDEARRLLIEMNAYLFDQHMSVAQRLLHDWLEPRNPISGRSDEELSAWKFDVAMVLLEQRLVERYLQDAAPTLTAIQEINDLQRNCLFAVLPTLNPTRQLAPLLSLAGVGEPVFSEIYDRVAVGIAWVTILHGRSPSEYRATMAAMGRELELQ